MVKTSSTKAVKTAVKKPKITTEKPAIKVAAVEVEVPEQQSAASSFFHLHGHAVLAFIYAVQALVIILLAKTFTLSITSGFIAKDTLASSVANETVLAPASRHFMDVNLGYLIAGVLLIAAITHLALAVIRRRDMWADSMIVRHGRRVRWAGLTLSVAGLVVIVALLLGMRDITALVGLKALILSAGVIGYLADEHQVISRRILVLLGALTTIVPVIILAIAAVHSSVYGELTGLTLGIASALLAGLVLLFAAFYYAAATQKSHKFSRSAFISISLLVIESAAAWQIFAGFLGS